MNIARDRTRMLSWLPLALYLLATFCSDRVQGDPPTFSNIDNSTVLNIDESEATGHVLITVTATDVDVNATVTLSTPGGSPFDFDAGSDDLKLQSPLDYETTTSYDVTIIATDDVLDETIVIITINVNDVNDNDPTLSITSGDVTMDEEEPAGTQVAFTYTASDPDTNDGTSLTYSLTGPDTANFNIEPASGNITLNTQVDIDPGNTNAVYKPVLEVSDGSRSATATLTLTLQDINDNDPVCSPSVAFGTATEEVTGGSPVYTLTCSDDDSSLNNNNVLTFSESNAYFAVDSTSGEVTVDSALDYETTTSEDLVVTVSDGGTGGTDTDVTITVSVTATNDNDPVWATFFPAPPTANTYAEDEDIAIGTFLFSMSATDADVDVGDTITYSIVSVSDGTNTVTGVFSVDPISGNVSTLATLDRDAGISQYTLNLQAEDGGTGSHIITTTIFLDLNDVNDNAPEFQSTPLSLVTIAEASAKTGSVVTTVSASDADITAASYTYEVSAIVAGGTATGDWAFSGTTAGQLEFNTDLDLDTGDEAVHVLRLIVKDGGVPELTGTTSLTVSISSDNEHTPTIATQPSGTVTFDEGQSVGTHVTDVTGSDNDVGVEGELVYSITGGNTGSAFTIDPDSGSISTATILDRETLDNYDLEITISDSAASVKSVTTSVSVSVTDVNDNQPTCTSLLISLTPAESVTTSSTLTTLTCSDPDPGDTLTYTVRTPHNTQFGFSSPVDELKLLTAMDYDSATQSYVVVVDVSDGTNSQAVTVSIDVDPVNEDTPTFASDPTHSVVENDVSNPIYTYTAADTDFSPHDITSYSITAVTNSGSSLFDIDASSGEISLTGPLDYEGLPSGDKTYELTVEATDGGGQTGTGTVTVSVTNINDNSPVCSQTVWTVDMDESQGGSGPYTVVADLGCTDAEDGSSVTYSLSQTPGSHFAVAAGAVTLTADTLDYETATQHTLTITVADAGTTPSALSSTVTVYVNVLNNNDGPPVFGALTAVDEDEDLAVGLVIVTVAAPDPDGDDLVYGDPQYSIISGDPSSNFAIDAESGIITLRKALDFETTTSYSLTIQALERGGTNSATATQDINVVDLNDESPTCSSYTFSETVSESEAVDYSVKSLGCSDDDAGTTLTYTITSGDTTLFKIETGILKLKAQLDYETAQSHDLTIEVSDGDSSHDVTITGTVTVGSVDEGAPVFSQTVYNVDVDESESGGYLVETVTATDVDSDLDANGQVKFSFVSSYTEFLIEESTGKITLATQLDRETDATHTLLVKAEDATAAVTATVSVTVSDINDNAPNFSLNPYTGSLSESDAAGTTIVTVAATDDDESGTSFATVTYAYTGSDDFAVDPSSGVVTNTDVLDADTGTSSYTLTITATDSGGGGGALTGTTYVLVTVTTVNQADPVFSPGTTSVTITENEFSINDVIATVTASDADTGTDGDFTFTFVNAQSKFSLTQRGDEADISLLQDLDYESGDTTFSIEVKATDQGNPPRSATGTVDITVDDENDNSPLCTSSVVNVNKDEGETSLGSISCSDNDAGTTLAYSIVSTTPGTTTPSISSSGVLTVASALDYETDTSYVIVIEVADDGVPQKSTTVTFNLEVNDLNDNDPSLTGPFTFTVSEDDTASSTVLYTATAASNDGPTDTLSFSLSDTTFFDVSSAGEVTLKTAAPDRETDGGTVTTDLCVSDSANPTVRSACQTLTVTVTDVNDVTPVFNPTVYTGSVSELASTSTALPTAVTATDADASTAYNTITYSITGGNTGTAFSIDGNTGVVSVNNALDYSTTSSYTLVIQASDGTHTATVNYNIEVISANRNTPVFTPSSESVTVNEDAELNDTVTITAVASDADSGSDGELTFSIDSGPFSIDSTTGTITVSGSLDRETTTSYSLEVKAVDGGATPKTGTLALTINIGDVNDETPSCSNYVYNSLLAESAAAGDAVATLVCTDDDDDPAGLNNDLTYTISSGSTVLFTVNNVGAVTVNSGASFDRETTAAYTLEIDVADKSSGTKLTFTATVLVTITDVNDETPYFTSIATANVAEDDPIGTTVTTVVAADDDDGVNAEIIYQIVSGNTGSVFAIDPASSAVTVLAELDYDTSPNIYELVISATDKGTGALSVTGTLTVSVTDVSDEPMVCGTSLYSTTTPENAAGTTLSATVACTKVDAAGSVTYSITAGDASGDFNIGATTGVLTTDTLADIDFEATPDFTLTITAQEGGFSATTTIKVTVTDVNEFSPAFSPAGPYTDSVDEDAAIGTTIRTVAATDGDTADTVKVYTITGGNSEAKFKVDSSTGVVQVQAPLDHETTPSYSLTLTVTDSGGSTGTVALDIDVDDINDNPPVCTATAISTDVDEDATSGNIYTPTCTDADTVATPSIEYSIISGDHASISINTASGALSLTGALDYETDTSHVVTIQASDQGSPTPENATVEVTIVVNPVNEHDPTFTPSADYGSTPVAEDESTGTSVAQVAATDADDGLEHGTIRFSIIGGDTNSQFMVDETSGVISVAKPLDREAVDSYTLSIKATDDTPGSAGERSATGTVTITVSDVNDETPIFNPTVYSVDVLETATSGPAVVIETLTVSDADTGANAAITLSFTSGNSEGKFSLSGNDLILANDLDYETTTSYDLVITATDGGASPLSSVARVTVNVLLANEMAPLMSEGTSALDLSEDTVVGTLVYDANATDSDSDTHGEITYSILSGVSGSEFIIDQDTGQLYVGSQLDYDTPPDSYLIVVQAEDGAGLADAATSVVTIDITLTDVNDHVPQFSSSMFTFSVEENSALDTSVDVVTVTDDDSGVNGEVLLVESGGTGTTYLDIDNATGLVFTASADIDYETKQVLYLSITATDGGVPSLTSAGLVRVDVINMNDNDPEISPPEFAVTISEDAVSGASVFTFTGIDADTAIDGFSLVSPSSFFKVDSATGEVTTKAALDRETDDTHTLEIRVLDLPTSGDPTTVRSATATLTVIVEDVNDNDPVISGSYSPSVDEDVGINELVVQVLATDDDAEENAQLEFNITAGNTGDAFTIDSQGNIQVAAGLDRETTASYSLTVVVSDQGSPPRSDQVNVAVTINDINDNDPVFSQASYSMNVAENSNVGTTVGRVTATDDDAGVNAALTYSLDAFTTGNGDHFAIDGATGRITVAEASLDRESTATYVATVKVTDNGSPLSRTAYATVTITIDDLNDNAPVLSNTYSATVAEDIGTGTAILTLVATDADIDENGNITYSMNDTLLDGAVADTFFEVDLITGIISPSTSLDYESRTTFTFVVVAEDQGDPALSDTATVTITVTDVNDNRPVFSPVYYNHEVAYDGTCTDLVTTVSATDRDSGANAVISYSIQTSAYGNLFVVSSSTGEITIGGVATPGQRYQLELQATDGGSPSLSASVTATVRIDAFVPNYHVITLRLLISRVNFLAQQDTFLAQLQDIVRGTHPTALVRLWCINEYSGTAVSPPTGRRRLLADSPVEVHTYVLTDNTTESESSVSDNKDILTQDAYLALISPNTDGSPGPLLQGSAWDYYQIVEVSEYYQSTTAWWDTLYGKLITIIAGVLGLLWLGALVFMIAGGFRYWRNMRPPSPKTSKVFPRVEMVETLRATKQAPAPRPMWDNNWGPDTAVLPDALAQGDTGNKQRGPPRYSQIDAPQNNPRVESRDGPRTPASVTFSADGVDSSGIVNRQFNGRAMDQETGRMYEYNTRTNERFWM